MPDGFFLKDPHIPTKITGEVSCQNFTADLGISPCPAVATMASTLDSWRLQRRRVGTNDVENDVENDVDLYDLWGEIPRNQGKTMWNMEICMIYIELQYGVKTSETWRFNP